MPAVVLSPGVWLQIGLDGAQRPALRAMTYPWDSIQSGVCCPSLARPRQSVRGQPAQVDADAAAVSSAGSTKSCSAWLCGFPGYMRSLLAWPRGVGLRRLSADHAPWGDWWLTRPTASGFMGMMPQSKRQLGTQEPDANCQVQCRLTLLPTRTRRRALPALHLQQRQRVSMG